MSSQDILVVAEADRGQVTDISLQMLGAARQLAAATGGKVVAVLLSADGAAYADALSAADRILLINDLLLAGYAPLPYVSVLEKVIATEGPRLVLVGSTSAGLDVGPLLGAKLDVPVINGCCGATVDGGAVKVTAGFYAGKLLADVSIASAPAILLVAPGAFRPAEQKGEAQVERKAAPCRWRPGPWCSRK